MATEEPLGDAVLRLSTDERALLEGIKRAKLQGAGLEDAFRSVAGNVAAAFAAIGVGFSLHAFLEATKAAEREGRLLEAAVRATGGAAGFTAAQLSAQASVLQRLTAVSDESVMAAQRSLLAFRNVQGEAFRRGLQLSLDLAAAMGTDAAGAARTLGMALNDPAEGLDRLRRAGVQVTGATRLQIEAFIRSGDVLRAQIALLDEVARSYGGLAAAARQTLGGALANLRNVVEDNVLEIRGPFLDTLRTLVEGLARGVPGAVRLGAAAFAFFEAVVKNLTSVVMVLVSGLEALFFTFAGNRDRALEAARTVKEAFADLAATDPVKAAQDAYRNLGREQERLASESESLAASAGGVGRGYERMGAQVKEARQTLEQFGEFMRRMSETQRQIVSSVSDDQVEQIHATYQQLAASVDQQFRRQTMELQNSKITLAEYNAAVTAMHAERESIMSTISAAESLKREQYYRNFFGVVRSGWDVQMNAAKRAIDTIAVKWSANITAMIVDGQKWRQSFLDILKDIVRAFIQAVIEMYIRWLAFKALTSIGLIGGGPMPGFAGRQHGGDVDAGRPYVVGERGPELFVPDRPGTIVPHGEAAAGAGPGAVTVNQTFNVTGMDFGSAEAARRFLRTAAAQMRAGAVEAVSFARAASDQNSLNPKRAYG